MTQKRLSYAEQVRRTKVGNAVSMAMVSRWPAEVAVQLKPSCDHPGCQLPATEGETFRIKNPPGSKYLTRAERFQTCDKHQHEHWKKIGFPPEKKPRGRRG